MGHSSLRVDMSVHVGFEQVYETVKCRPRLLFRGDVQLHLRLNWLDLLRLPIVSLLVTHVEVACLPFLVRQVSDRHYVRLA